MSAPVLPSEFQACIPDSTSSKCAAFVKALLRLPVLIWKTMAYIFDSAGDVSAEFKQGILATGTLEFAAAALPEEGRLLCDGRSLIRTEYEDLWLVIGAAYGSVDGSHFNLPDFSDRFPLGSSVARPGTSTGGAEEVTLTSTQIPKHAHHVLNTTDGSSGGMGFPTSEGSINKASSEPGGDRAYALVGKTWATNEPTLGKTSTHGGEGPDAEGEAAAHSNIPPYISVYIYIRT